MEDNTLAPKTILDILYENDDLVAINKPHGLLVHRSKIATDATEFALQLLRDQLKVKVDLAHRLDRKTSGVLLFTKNKTTNTATQLQFQNRTVSKTYLAIVRGYAPDGDTIDYDLTDEDGKVQSAVTSYKTLERFEIDVPSAGHPTSRYSLVELKPNTGRFHQLRKHMAHIFHPIIGDRPHGCNKQNKLWKERFNSMTMFLHAQTLAFNYKEAPITINAPLSKDFKAALEILEAHKVG